jgi:hypothetical protein
MKILYLIFYAHSLNIIILFNVNMEFYGIYEITMDFNLMGPVLIPVHTYLEADSWGERRLDAMAISLVFREQCFLLDSCRLLYNNLMKWFQDW